MNVRPEISVIVPVYGVENFLRQCVESVLAQTFSAWELILVNDGSPDRCGAICDEFARRDPRIKAYHIPNSGVSAARNFGLSKAVAPYITFVDADDLIDESMLRLMYGYVKSYQVEAVCVDFQQFAGSLERRNIRSGITELPVSSQTYVRNALYQTAGNASVCGKLLSRHILGDNPFPRDQRYEDLDTFYRFLLRTDKIVYSPLRLYYYRTNPDSYINTFTLARADVLDVTDRMALYMRDNYPGLVKAADDRRLSAHFNILCLMAANNMTDPGLETRCWRVIKEYRWRSLFNPEVRMKNKAGIIASLIGGKSLVRLLGKWVYR